MGQLKFSPLDSNPALPTSRSNPKALYVRFRNYRWRHSWSRDRRRSWAPLSLRANSAVEKEAGFAQHQTGRNSGVIHSGIYYKPGSLKAEMAKAGNQSLRDFCYEYGVPFDLCGKLIVATTPDEVPLLEGIFDRALKNGVPALRLRPEEVKEVEPHVACLAAIRVPTTGIVDYRQVCHALVHEMQQQGAELKLGTEILQVVPTPVGHLLETTWGSLETRFLINCAGLHSDRVARLGAWNRQP